MRDYLRIVARLPRLLPWVRTQWMPRPWARCHCGDLATIRDLNDQSWCAPCRYQYSIKDNCECSVSQAAPLQAGREPLRWSASPERVS